jgi:hypothetical protein
MKSREILALAKADATKLMLKVCESHDAVNANEIAVAKKISTSRIFEYQLLEDDEIDALINLLGYYWDITEERTEVFIDFLINLKNTRSTQT